MLQAACCALILAEVEEELMEELKKTRGPTREWIKKRKEQGDYHNLRVELLLEDSETYKRWLRMDDSCFNFILDLIYDDIVKQDTNFQEAISPGERLTITLRFLATGMTFVDLAYCFRVSERAVSYIVMETCRALYQRLKYTFNTPKNPAEWQAIARQYEARWNFPQCLGAIDGKHIVMKTPKLSGSHFHNYKGTRSIVLMAIVDADYKFIYVDVGTQGRMSDGGVWNKCNFKQMLDTKLLNLPPPSALPGRQQAVPYVFIADDAFGLKDYLMKPYSRTLLDLPPRVFNYRLSRARRMVESAFGILANRFRVFLNPINLEPEKVQDVVLAGCSVHNLLRIRGDTEIGELVVDHENVERGMVQPGRWRSDVRPTDTYVRMVTTYSNNPSALAQAVRNEYRD